tara:strand:+ start:5055 stop:6197 length:1143 start_codon:yes stop_codon:yes gene_type:complete
MAVLGFAGFVSGTSIRVAEPLLPKLADEFARTPAAAAVVITAFALAYGLFQLVHGPIGDRFGKLRTVRVALFLAGAASFACASASSLEALSVYRFLAGMTSGAVIPLAFAYIGDHYPFDQRQAVLGRFIGGILLGGVLGPLLGGGISDWIGWRYVFVIPGFAFLLASLLLGMASRGETGAKPSGGVIATYLTLLNTSVVRAMCAFVLLEAFLYHGAFAFVGVYMRDAFDFSLTTIGLCLAGVGVGGFLYSLTVGQLVRHLGQARMVLVAGVVLAMLFGGLAAFALPAFMAPTLILLGYSFAMLHNTMQTFATEMAPGARGAGVALFAFSLFFGQAVGVHLAGQVIESNGYIPVFVIAAVGLVLLALGFSAWIRRRQLVGN